jgi:hypothetical protein
MANNRTHFVVGSGQFINLNPNLLVWEKFDVLNHLQNIGDAELPILEHWNEDGVILDYSYKIDTTQNTVLTNLSIALVAYNAITGDRFEFDRVSVNLNPNIGLPQLIDSQNTRNYILPASSQFNLVRLERGSQSGNFRFYNGSLGQKMTWQEWIRNSGVNSIFYSNSEPNNNLNQEIDNYSNENGYEIHLLAIANVDSNVGSFEYERYSTVINVYDYLESDDGVITAGLIETFDATETVPLNGSILQDADTLFKVTWSGPAALNLANLGYIIHSIEPKDAPTNLQIEQSSTFRGIVTGGKLTTLSTTQVGNTIVSRCLIKAGALLDDNWKLSARIQTPGLPTTFGIILIHQTNPNGRNVTFTARKPIFPNNKTFFSVNNDVTTADLRFRIGNTTAALNDANNGGWAAFPEILWAAFVGVAIGEGVKVRVSYLGTSERTDLLSTIRVSVDETTVATVVNIIPTNSRTAASDVLLPFITPNSVNLVTTQFGTNKFSAKRTNLEIANSSNLTAFVTGIVPLTGLTNNEIGHLYAENTTVNGIGQLSIQSVATTPSEGATVAIGCPLSNQFYPVTGNGLNVPALQGDGINDQLFVPNGANGSNKLYPEYMTVGESRTYSFLGNGLGSGVFIAASGSVINDTGGGGGLVSIYFTGGVIQYFNDTIRYDNNLIRYFTVTITRLALTGTAAQCYDIVFYRNGKRFLPTTVRFSTNNNIPIVSSSVFNIGNYYRSGNLQTDNGLVAKLNFFSMHNRILTFKEIRELHLGKAPLSFNPLYHYDLTNVAPGLGNRTIPNTGSGTIDAAQLQNHTNNLTTLFL